ncbi:la-related protein 6C-like [Corylus avellana]|uniref:la-related protein 6C-like n=1 Tax=Corylus avellana TaxID=13451 RepID=UPI001E21A446|nr:la-related protein 6C-like [Corylus avellana]
MAQAQPEEKMQENDHMKQTNSPSFRFNAQAPEFVPRSLTQMPAVSDYAYPACFHFLGGSGGSDWIYVGDQEPSYLISNPNPPLPDRSKSTFSDDLQQKIIKQVEYQFSDMSLLANDSFMKHVNKDPEGYVPIPVIASTKKIKSLVNINNTIITQALRSSSRLVVSSDGKKVRRKHPFTEKEKEDLQSRTVVAENLPEDHSHQNLEKIFGVVGSVKAVRICYPQESHLSRSKGDCLVSNKLHALVEYETADKAEKAVEKLNDERNWRIGLRVRSMIRRSPRCVLKNRKSELDGILEDSEAPPHESIEDSCQPNNTESVVEGNAEENSLGSKKGWGRVRGKWRGRGLSHCGRGLLLPSSPLLQIGILCEASANHPSKSPRMPDGTRGFTMGRGKPLTNIPPHQPAASP